MFRGGPQLRTKIRMIEVKAIISHKTEWQILKDIVQLDECAVPLLKTEDKYDSAMPSLEFQEVLAKCFPPTQEIRLIGVGRGGQGTIAPHLYH